MLWEDQKISFSLNMKSTTVKRNTSASPVLLLLVIPIAFLFVSTQTQSKLAMVAVWLLYWSDSFCINTIGSQYFAVVRYPTSYQHRLCAINLCPIYSYIYAQWHRPSFISIHSRSFYLNFVVFGHYKYNQKFIWHLFWETHQQKHYS